jgi:hypothetical protein
MSSVEIKCLVAYMNSTYRLKQIKEKSKMNNLKLKLFN